MTLTGAKKIEIEVPGGVSTLAWKGDDLFDMAAGEVTVSVPSGSIKRKYLGYGSRFDRGCACVEGCHQAIYETLGTKALLRPPSEALIELDRSYYHAEVYEYPLALFHRGGRALVAHCPLSYRQLHIDDADTGQRLTASDRSEAHDFFHSRLEASPDGRYLLSAGWFWHPWEDVMLFDLDEALANPQSLDGAGLIAWTERRLPIAAEVAAATFSGTDRLVVATKGTERLDDPDHEKAALGGGELGCWSIAEKEWVSRSAPTVPLGTLMAVGENHVLSLLHHPRLIELENGAIVEEWPGIASGGQEGSLMLSDEAKSVPPMARDPVRRRLAVGAASGVTVIWFSAESERD